jgi:hypothetical protein
MNSYFRVATLTAASVVQCWTCGALVPEDGKTRHRDWHAGLASEVRQLVLAEANGHSPQETDPKGGDHDEQR